MKTPKIPAPPDPVATAAAQTQSNKDTAAYTAAIQNGNVTTPYGSQTVTWGGSGPASYDWNGQTFGSTDELKNALTRILNALVFAWLLVSVNVQSTPCIAAVA